MKLDQAKARRELDRKAWSVSTSLLTQIKYAPEAFRPVPIGRVAHALEIQIVESSQSPTRGALWSTDRPQPSLFGDFVVTVWDQSAGRRFTLAHELAHRAADLFLASEEVATWTANDQRVFADQFASYLLLPDSLITESFGVGKRVRLDLGTLKRIQKVFGLSMSALAARLNHAARRKVIRLLDLVLVATAGVSLRQGLNYAPRVVSRCTPDPWYIPLNKRLESIGLTNLDRLYWTGSLYQDGIAEDSMSLWSRERHDMYHLTRTFQYILFQTASAQRILVACCPQDG